MEKIFETYSENETEFLGKALGRLLAPGDIIALKGDLGAGKTAFTRGIAQGLGIRDDVTSPTFTIINDYTDPIPFAHMDAYRIKSLEEMENVGFSDYLSEYVVVVEWADRIKPLLPEDLLWVDFKGEGDNRRKIHFISKCHRFDQILQELNL
jgi:tRNA threonylcarbamoyladenosine biosynthesis protein TsaE